MVSLLSSVCVCVCMCVCEKWNGGGCLFSVTVRRVERERERERERETFKRIFNHQKKKLSVIFGCYWCFFLHGIKQSEQGFLLYEACSFKFNSSKTFK